jgi:hypothetical protein
LAAGQLHDPRLAFRLELDRREQFVDGRAVRIKRSEQPQRLFHRQLVDKLRFLQLNAEPRPQPWAVGPPAFAQHFDVAGIGVEQSFENFDRGGLPRAVGPEQAKALAAPDLEIEAVDSDDVGVFLHQAVTRHGVIDSAHAVRF